MQEKILKILFDYQRFEGNEKLKDMIAETEARYQDELSDDELELVSAAGTSEYPSPRINP